MGWGGAVSMSGADYGAGFFAVNRFSQILDRFSGSKIGMFSVILWCFMTLVHYC
jgi:hypothetical protein